MSNEQHDHKPAGAGANSNLAGAPEHEALYDRFTERASELFATGQEDCREAMERAMDAAGRCFARAIDVIDCRNLLWRYGTSLTANSIGDGLLTPMPD